MATKKEANIDTTKKEKIENEDVKNEKAKRKKQEDKEVEVKKVTTKRKSTAKVKDATKKETSRKKKEAETEKTDKTEKKVEDVEKKNSVKSGTKKASARKKITNDKEIAKTKTEVKEKETTKKKSTTPAEIKDEEKIVLVEEEEKISNVPVEKMVSIQEIKQTIKKKQKLPKEEIEKINKCIFQNIMVALCIIIYFIFLNLGHINIQGEVYVTDLKVFSMCILLLAIALIEKAYKNDDGKIAIYGVEMIVLSLVTVALIYVNLMLSTRYAYIVTSISYIFAIYYLIKSIVIYIRKRKKYFVDGMKEIINNKDE